MLHTNNYNSLITNFYQGHGRGGIKGFITPKLDLTTAEYVANLLNVIIWL